MKTNKYLIYFIWLLMPLLGVQAANAQSKGKTIYIPERDYKQHGFDDPEGRFSYDYMKESKNLAIFWEKSFGKDPTVNADKEKRFYPDEILEEGEKYFNFFIKKMKFLKRRGSHADKHKMIIWMYDDEDKTAYGGANENVGMVWFRPARISGYPYCTLVHELGHSFQTIAQADFNTSLQGTTMYEYTSQWMLWQLYPDWITIENYHLETYMNQTHYTLFHGINQYSAPQFMEYWSNKHGLPIIGKIWQQRRENEDIASTYMRLANTSHEKFNAEIYDAASRFITWDIPRIKSVGSSYANQHHTKLTREGDGWYSISKEKCPQSYGYNAIRLNVPRGGSEVELTFEGIAGDERFYTDDANNAGWRYGFVAVKQDGKRVYGKMNTAQNGTNGPVKFVVPDKTQFLWLVVTGAPNKHYPYIPREKEIAEWPYRIHLNGATLHNAAL